MLDNRVQGFEQVNEMFDLNIEVEFMSSWKANNDDVEILDDEILDLKIDDLKILEDDVE